MTQIITRPIKAEECRFAVYIPPPEQGMPDLHFIKKKTHYEDGTSAATTSLIRDFQRPFWTTKTGFQDHKDKKEWEDITRLNEGKSTQTKLVDNISKALGMPWFKGNLRKLCTSPYVYGADILSTAIIKKAFQDKYPNIQTKYSVGTFDVETDVLNGTGEIIMATFTYNSVVFTAVVESYVRGVANVQERLKSHMDKYLGEYVEKRKLVSELVIVPTPYDAVKACMDKAHEHKPDFLAIWNMDFDITKVLNACEKAGVDPAELFSDPSIPRDYRYFKYVRGPSQKVTAGGKVTPIKPSAQWHTVYTPSSFYIIDAMCVYRLNRIGQPEIQSYSLDFVLDLNLGIRKLKFEEAKEYENQKLKWHEVMQSQYKLEYIIYNRFDCISMEELDEKTLDLSLTLPLFCGYSDFAKYNSQPRRSVDKLHYYCLENKQVIGTTGQETSTDLDDTTVDLSGWITMLPAHLVADNGLKLIEEYPELTTNVRGHVGD